MDLIVEAIKLESYMGSSFLFQKALLFQLIAFLFYIANRIFSWIFVTLEDKLLVFYQIHSQNSIILQISKSSWGVLHKKYTPIFMYSLLENRTVEYTNLFIKNIVQFINATIFIVFIFFSLFFHHWFVGLATLIVAILIQLDAFFLRKRTKILHLNLVKKKDNYFKSLSVFLQNYDSLYFFNKENLLFKKTLQQSKEHLTITKEQNKVQSLLDLRTRFISNILGYLLFVATLSILFFNAFTEKITPGIIFIIPYTLSAISPQISLVTTSLRNIYSFKDLKNNLYIFEKNDEGQELKISNIRAVNIQNLNFYYEKTPIIKMLNFQILPGTKTIITGKNGSGKTTFLKILSGILTNYSGKIYINNKINYKIFNEKSKRDIVSLYITENFVFDDNIVNNITLWEKKYDKQKLKHAIFSANLQHDFPDYETNTQSCLKFSEGQKQRINLARIFYEQKPIIILDEPFAFLDKKNIQIILKNFLNNQNVTLIMADHRLKEERKLFDFKLSLKGYEN